MGAALAAQNKNIVRQRILIVAAIGAGLAFLAIANGHLVLAAVSSQPPCVDHLKSKGEAPGDYRAATPSC